MSNAPLEGISVVLIAKNCAKSLDETLESLKPFLRPGAGDEIVVVDTGSTDVAVPGADPATVETARRHGARVFRHPELTKAGMLDLVKKYLPGQFGKCAEDPQFADGFLADFAAARNLADSYARNDLVFWIDSDDVLVGAAALRQIAAEHFAQSRLPLFMAYDYSFEADGACNTVLWRERILPKSTFEWVGICHESMIGKDRKPSEITRVPPEMSKISHKNGRHHLYSDIRNYAILRNAYDSAEWKDPRWEFYLGNACRGLGEYKEAVNWYARLINRSGSPDDRFASLLNIAYCYILFGRPWRAIDFLYQATKVIPNEPRAWFGIARAHFELRRFKDVLLFSQIGRAMGGVHTLNAHDPNSVDFYPGFFEALSYKELGDASSAVAKADEVLSLRPGNPEAEGLNRDIRQWAALEGLKQAITSTVQHTFSTADATRVLQSLRPEVRKLIPEIQIESYCTKPTYSITFLCGKTFEDWDPTSLETGIGGSEKMVILLAREFAKAGYRVDVYGSPKAGNHYKVFDKVTYKPAGAFNPALQRDTLIVWRNWGFLDMPLKANRIFLDAHDVQDPGNATDARLAKLTGIFLKSEFHAQPLRGRVPDDKLIITRNAIDPALFDGEAARDYRKIIYASSADRGLLTTLRLFARIKAIRPEAELHTYYGFTPLYIHNASRFEYQNFGDDNCDRHMLDYAEQCFDLAERLGVQNHGRIGAQVLADEMKSASILLYPTKFPEISCMAAIEAQAAGCIPVTSNTGALAETVKHGCQLDANDADAFVANCVSILEKGADLDATRLAMSTSTRRDYAVADLAAEWLATFEKPDESQRTDRTLRAEVGV